jgi:hypothetical protein
MELSSALSRLGFRDQTELTVDSIERAWERAVAGVVPSVDDVLTKKRLSEARDVLVAFEVKLRAQEQAVRDRVSTMRALEYDRAKPMDYARAISMFEIKADDVYEDHEIEAIWERNIIGMVPRKNVADPYSKEKDFNQARDLILARMALPEQQEALERVRQASLESQARLQANFESSLEPEPQELLETSVQACLQSDSVVETVLDSDRRQLSRRQKRRIIEAERASMPAKRSHRQASSNKDGVRFIDTVKKVLAESFETNEGGQVFFGDIFDAVSKATPMSAVRENLLHRHSRRLFTEQWTSAGSAMVDSVRCFTGVSLKK